MLWNDRSKPLTPASTPLAPGSMAPNFRLPWKPEQTLDLRKTTGRPVVLAFYPADWEPVSIDQLRQLHETLPELVRLGAQVLGLSVDSVWSHAAFARELALTFPLLADFHPKGAVARAYGVIREADGTSERALFVINPHGRIAWSYVAPLCVNPGIDGILTVLETMEKSW